MQQTLRPYATAGIAIVGTSLIAVTPVSAALPDIQSFRDVALTAGETLPDLLGPWEDVFNTASANATQLTNNYFLAPEVGLQQFIANQTDFYQQILSDPSSIPDVMNQVQENLKAVSDAYALIGADADTVTTTILHTLNGGFALDPTSGIVEAGHSALFQLLPAILPPDQAETLTPIIDFLASPLSGVIIGSLGPAISPLVALSNSIGEGDGLGETMANMVGAYFNGATLNLDGLIPIIEQSGLLPLPEGTDIHHLEFAFGGLLSAGEVSNANYEIFDGSGNVVASIPAAGGSIFNSLGLTIDASLGAQALTLNVDGVPVGPIGAMMGWSQAIAGLLGADAWAWDGKTPGQPPAEPPLAGLSFPLIPEDFFDDGGAGGAAGDVGATAAAEFANALQGFSGLPDLAADIVAALAP